MGLVSIHSFLMKRMTAVAEEIFDAVKGSIIEYEQEIERLKQENASLKSTLNQNRSSARHDSQRPGDEVLQGPLGSELSEIRVKMEVAAVMSQEPMSHASTSTSEELKWQGPHRSHSHLPNGLLKSEDNGDTDAQLSITVKSELCDNQANDLHSSAVQCSSDSQAELPVPEQDQLTLQLDNQTSAEVPQRAVQSHQNILICRFCRRIFRTKGRLQRHILVHRNDTPFNWSLSGSRFKSKINLKPNERLHTERQADGHTEDSQVSHVEIILQPDSVNEDTNQQNSTRSSLYDQGPGKYPFYCKICDRPFRRQKSMKNHMILHQGDRNHPCKFCGRRFYKSWHLAEHLRIHTGEKPFGCNECGKRFVQWNQARSHIIKHHAGDMSLLSKS